MSNSARPRLPLGMVIFAFLLGGIQLLLLGFWAGNREKEAEAPRSSAAPRVVVIEPAADRVLGGDVAVVFETSPPLRPLPDGWGAASWRLTAELNGVERVPTRDEVEIFGNGRYRWVLHDVRAGEHELRLFLAPMRSGVEKGEVAVVRFRVE